MGTVRTQDQEVADRLGRAFGVWRLRPGDVEHAALVVACGRLQSVLGKRPGVTLGVHGTSFLTSDGGDEGTGAGGALAGALYELGVERLRLHRPPSIGELDAFFRAVDAADDRDDLARRLGGLTAVIEPVGIAPTAAHPDDEEEAADWREAWMRLADPVSIADELTQRGSDAGAVRRWLETQREALPEDRQRSPALADRLHAVLLHLPAPLRDAVARDLVEAPDAPFPGWFLCSLTDHDLGVLLGGLTDDVAGMARRSLGRDLGDLRTDVTVPVADTAPASEPLSDAPQGLRLPDEDSPLGIASLELFLSFEVRPERTRAALLHWQRRVRDALAQGDLPAVHELLAALHRVNAVAEHDLTAVLDAACAQALGTEELDALLPSLGESIAPAALDLLRAFGPIAVDTLVARLVGEQDAQRRAQIVSVLAVLVPGHTEVLRRWLADDRWFVVRNVVTALWRAADPGAVPLLRTVISHHEPRVRLETARALAAVGAVGDLVQLAADPDDEVRTSSRRMLAGLASADAAAALAAIVRNTEVPLPDRRSAVDALASHPHGAARLSELAGDHDLPMRLRWHVGRAGSGG